MFENFTAWSRQWLTPEGKAVAAVSGGADSMCLAHLLWRLSKQGGARVHIAHVNHQLRGQAAREDAAFVRQWSEEHGLECTVVEIDLKHQGGKSMQELAREERYRALVDVCVRWGASILVTGHHAGDQVETFLLNLLRGSGSQGLRGIPAKRSLERGVTVYRPLLKVSRQEIESYCRENNIVWRTDSSNQKTDYVRNRIRHQLLPHLRLFNPGIERVLLNTMATIDREQALLDKLTEAAQAQIVIQSPLDFAPVALSIEGLRQLDEALRYRVIARFLGRDGQSRHIEAVLRLIDANTGSSLDLPGQKAYRLDHAIAFGGPPRQAPSVHEIVPIPGETAVEAFGIQVKASLDPMPEATVFWLPHSVASLEITRRRKGDYFYPGEGGKKLKDYLIDRKIPRWLRDDYPVIRAEGKIIWVVGLVKDSRYLGEAPGTRPVFITINRREE